jgi:hypothetical protein
MNVLKLRRFASAVLVMVMAFGTALAADSREVSAPASQLMLAQAAQPAKPAEPAVNEELKCDPASMAHGDCPRLKDGKGEGHMHHHAKAEKCDENCPHMKDGKAEKCDGNCPRLKDGKGEGHMHHHAKGEKCDDNCQHMKDVKGEGHMHHHKADSTDDKPVDEDKEKD